MGISYGITQYGLLRLNYQVIGNRHRATRCLRLRIAGKQAVVKKRENGKTSYGNLAQCGSVWACPVCSFRIAQGRADEISKAVAIWGKQGKKVAMVTYTMAHKKNQSLGHNLHKIIDAYATMQSHRKYRELRKLWKHQINAREITLGENGWHVHLHVLLFLDGDIDPKAVQDSLFVLWSSYVSAKKDIGVRLTYGHDQILAKYMSKVSEWGVGQEIALQAVKVGGFNYLDLLINGDSVHAIEYALATNGINRLTWSQNSKKAFGIGEKSDLELAIEEQKKGEVFATIPAELWRIISSRDYDLREYVLELAEDATDEQHFLSLLESELDHGS